MAGALEELPVNTCETQCQNQGERVRESRSECPPLSTLSSGRSGSRERESMREDPWASEWVSDWEEEEEEDEELFSFAMTPLASSEADNPQGSLSPQVDFLWELLRHKDQELHAARHQVAQLQLALTQRTLTRGEGEESSTSYSCEVEIRRLLEQLDDRDRQLEVERMRSRVLKESVRDLMEERRAHERTLLDLEAEKMKTEALKTSLNQLSLRERALRQAAVDLEEVSREMESERVRNRMLESELTLLRKEPLTQSATRGITPLGSGHESAVCPQNDPDVCSVKWGPSETQKLGGGGDAGDDTYDTHAARERRDMSERQARIQELEDTLSHLLSLLEDERQRVNVGRVQAWCLTHLAPGGRVHSGKA